jgi:2-oxoglutarate dehydrogenase complex dehydrogenase (E1) component-like enzyme
MSKTKTINVNPEIHKLLRDYCKAAGLKVGAVTEQAIRAWLTRRSR